MSLSGNICTLSFCVLLLCCSGLCSPVPSEERHLIPGELKAAVESSLLKQDDNVDMEDILGQFLHMLNFTDQRPLQRPRTSRIEPPEYMLELYNRFANDRTAVPPGNIVRSFKNEDHSAHNVMSKSLQTHPLLFNISVPQHERVIKAELRLHTLLKRDTRHLIRVGWKVTIFERQRGGHFGNAADANDSTGDKDQHGMQELASKCVHRKESGWEVFDLTKAVQHWRRSSSLTHRLEVHIENLNRENVAITCRNTNEWNGQQFVDLDIDRNPNGKHEPVLIIFSDDHQKGRRELKQMIKVEDELPGINERWTDENEEHEEQDEALLMQMRSNVIYDNAPRVRRSAKVEDCKRAELYVDFKDIGWDSWVVTPAGYQAYTCRGVCNYPLAPEVTPTKHAIIQTLLNLKSPQRASQACCVPTKLEPISLLYENKNGVVVLKHKYEGMVVMECGCR
ncbi:bone morphogenetic protein 10-like [Myxocyprinus asiaticus]|uniref:bone morphogenetic protein 10-like n=1 Tax=Myxocyprinus asiaticus TaxID=70543 RepID=UPI00222276C1|nr:bone morphogenetic protein 10-like [Myxocyprinus asiaticus]